MELPLNVFLLPLLGGYIFVSRWNVTEWYSARWEKERLLLNSATYGLWFYGAALSIIRLQDYLPCVKWLPCLPRWPTNIPPFDYLGVSLLSCFIGFVLPILGNLIWTKEKTNRKLIQNEGTLTEILLDRAMRTSRTVMITLKSGKVYVGFPLSLPSPGRAQQVIQILQTLSGYREADKHRVVFTTNYSKALNEIHSDCDELTLEIYAKEGERKSIEQQIGTTEKSLVEEQEQLVVDRNSIRLIPPDKVKASRLQELEKQENAIAEKHKTIEEWRAKVRDLRDEVSSLEYQSRRLLSSVEDFGVLIPVDQIASMTLYHASIHTKYFAHIDAAPGEIQHSLPKKP